MNAVIDIAALAEQLRRVTVEVTDAGELLGSGVLWPQGFGARFDIGSAVIALAAAAALFRFKVGVIPLLAACAAAGRNLTAAEWTRYIGSAVPADLRCTR